MPLPQNKDSLIAEFAEWIVIDYANLSGREDTNRAEFRKRTIEHLQKFLNLHEDRVVKEVEALETQKFLDKKCKVADFVKIDSVLAIIKSNPLRE